MDMLLGFVQARREITDLAGSALPGAPVVAPVEAPQQVHRARLALSRGLHRLAQAVAPPQRSPAC